MEGSGCQDRKGCWGVFYSTVCSTGPLVLVTRLAWWSIHASIYVRSLHSMMIVDASF